MTSYAREETGRCTLAEELAEVVWGFFSKEEKVKDNTQEQQGQDPVAWVDVKDEQADVKKPDAHVGEVQSIQCESSMDKVPTSSSPQSRSVLT